MEYSPPSICSFCEKEQEELFERTGGSCGQIICCHQQLIDEETIRYLEENQSALSQLLDDKSATTDVSSSVNRRPASPTTIVKTKKRKGEMTVAATPTTKKVKKGDSFDNNNMIDDKCFPSVQEMEESRNLTMDKLPQDKVFQIMTIDFKDETYQGETKKNMYVTLRAKGEKKTDVIRATDLLKAKLCLEECYMDRCKTYRFYFLNMGWKVSQAQKNYRDFIIKSVKM